MKKKEPTFNERVDEWTRYLFDEFIQHGSRGLRNGVFMLMSSEADRAATASKKKEKE